GKVAAERRRDLESELEIAAAEAAIQLLAAADRRPLVEITRASRERLDQSTALGRSILVENTQAQILDVERDTVAEGDHENDRPEKGKCQPDRVAEELHRLAAAAGPQPAESEATAAGGRLGRRPRG